MCSCASRRVRERESSRKEFNDRPYGRIRGLLARAHCVCISSSSSSSRGRPQNRYCPRTTNGLQKPVFTEKKTHTHTYTDKQINNTFRRRCVVRINAYYARAIRERTKQHFLRVSTRKAHAHGRAETQQPLITRGGHGRAAAAVPRRNDRTRGGHPCLRRTDRPHPLGSRQKRPAAVLQPTSTGCAEAFFFNYTCHSAI